MTQTSHGACPRERAPSQQRPQVPRLGLARWPRRAPAVTLGGHPASLSLLAPLCVTGGVPRGVRRGVLCALVSLQLPACRQGGALGSVSASRPPPAPLGAHGDWRGWPSGADSAGLAPQELATGWVREPLTSAARGLVLRGDGLTPALRPQGWSRCGPGALRPHPARSEAWRPAHVQACPLPSSRTLHASSAYCVAARFSRLRGGRCQRHTTGRRGAGSGQERRRRRGAGPPRAGAGAQRAPPLCEGPRGPGRAAAPGDGGGA